jgi:hypothetical protein
MMTLEERLSSIVALLPAQTQARFTAPHGPEESTDTRIAEAVRCLAKAEGLVCMTADEFARANAQQAAQRSQPVDTPAADDSHESLATQFAAITDPRAQTAFWRSLTAEQRAVLTQPK